MRPAGTSTSPNAKEYPATIHWISEAPAPSPDSMEGSATLTIETSRRVMNPAARTKANARHGVCDVVGSALIPAFSQPRPNAPTAVGPRGCGTGLRPRQASSPRREVPAAATSPPTAPPRCPCQDTEGPAASTPASMALP